MSQRLKQYLNDVFDGKNMNILEIGKDPNLQNRYQSIIKSLNITDNQTLERCMKIIASESLKPPMKDGHIASLILFSMELDSYHSINSTSWYRRHILTEILHDILSHSSKEKDSNVFGIFSFVLFVCMSMLLLNICRGHVLSLNGFCW